MHKLCQIVLTCIFVFILAACQPGSQAVPGQGETQAAYTMVAVLTQAAFQTVEAKLTEVSARPSETPAPTEAETPLAVTLSPVAKAGTPGAVPSLPAAGGLATQGASCNQVGSVIDVNMPDGTAVKPGEKFSKIWRIKNAGTCTWTKAYDLIPAGGAEFTTLKEIPLTKEVKTGATIDMSVEMVAPTKEGTYISYWEMQDNTGRGFGLGGQAKGVFWVKIVVGGGTAEGASRVVYSMASNVCYASWLSSTGSLNCPGAVNTSKGSISSQNSVVMEDGSTRSGSTLIAVPNPGGAISGVYPAIQINEGDTFSAVIGCLGEHPDCDIAFSLSYKASDGQTGSLGSWGHTEDGYSDELNIDLSSLAGRTASLILNVNANSSSTDNIGYWISPRVWH